MPRIPTIERLRIAADNRRALYAEATLMVRQIDNLSANFVQYYVAVVAASVLARGGNWLQNEQLGYLLAIVSLVFLLIALRMRRNHDHYYEFAAGLEVELRSTGGPHTYNLKQLDKPDPLAFVQISRLYYAFYVVGIAMGLVLAFLLPVLKPDAADSAPVEDITPAVVQPHDATSQTTPTASEAAAPEGADQTP